MEQEELIKALKEWYITTHCMDEHSCRQYSLFIKQVIKVIETNEGVPEIPNCDCYECKAA
jgi:hypothetical protein